MASSDSLKLDSTITLNDGRKFPRYGLGTWRSGTGEVAEAVYLALKAGYRHIDAAAAYFNQDEVGAGIKRFLDETPSVKREDLWITSKLYQTEHRPDIVETACRLCCEQLGLDYLDLYLIHWPAEFEVKEGTHKGWHLEAVKTAEGWSKRLEQGNPKITPIKDTWIAMEKLVDAGLTKSIGVSNFNIAMIKDMLTYARIPPATNQVESHPFWVQPALFDFLKENGITMTAYCPLGNTKFENKDSQKFESPMVNDDVLAIAKKYNKTGAQVVLRWSVQSGRVCIPKTVTPSRVTENADIFDFSLTDEEMAKVGGFKTQQVRQLTPGWLAAGGGFEGYYAGFPNLQQK